MLVKNDYNYTMSLGPINLKCQSSYAKDLQRLDSVLECLNQPNDQLNSLGLFSRSITVGKVKLARILNFFRTGVWMNDACARKIVKHYTTMSDLDKRPDQTDKIKVLYNRLAQIKRGSGTYADGINPDLIQPQPQISVEKLAKFAEDVFKQLLADPDIQDALKFCSTVAVDTAVSITKKFAMGCFQFAVSKAFDTVMKNYEANLQRTTPSTFVPKKAIM